MHPPTQLALPVRGAAWLYALLKCSVPKTVEDPHGVLKGAERGESLLFACRHGQLLALLWSMEPYHLTVMASHSRDGQLLAGILSRTGFELIRGSTTRDGRPAARQAVRALESGARLGMAVDGPRGPRGCVHNGVLRIARRAGVPVVPLSVEGAKPWILPGSWDRFEIPRPGGRVWVRVHRPLEVCGGAQGITKAGDALAHALDGWRQPSPDAGGLGPEPSPSYGHS